MIDKLPAEASLYGDSAYTDYGLEDIVLQRKTHFIKDTTQVKREENRYIGTKK